jgi:enoyl-CoA hydratase
MKGFSMDFSVFPKEFKFDLTDGILTVTLNNPSQRNAIATHMDDLLPRIFFEADQDPRVEIIVVTGEGLAFSAGGDLEGMKRNLEGIDNFLAGYRNGKRFMQLMLDTEKPIIGKVNGDAIGMGCTLALCCDIVVASETARFADPHIRVGLAAGDGGAVFWPANIGSALAKYFLLTGDLISARDAKDMGLIAKVVAPEELDAEVDRVLGRLRSNSMAAIRFSKSILNIPLRQGLASMVDAGFALESISSQLPDHREAVQAFAEKRKPRFRK